MLDRTNRNSRRMIKQNKGQATRDRLADSPGLLPSADSAGISIRAIITGAFLCLLLSIAAPYNLTNINGSYLALDHNAAGAIALFFIFVAGVNFLLRLIARAGGEGSLLSRLPFGRSEMLTIYEMLIVSSSLCTMGLHTELQMLGSVGKAIESVETKLNELAATNQDIQRLQTVAGVGPRLAETLVAFLDDPHRFKSGKQVGSYVGLTPRQYQSGLSDRQGRISGQGNKLLRTLLVEISWISLRYNPWARETYDRLLRGSPSRKNIAIVAVARKLLVRCWAMLRDQQDWRYEKEVA